MISKVITGSTFFGACRYVCMDKNRAVVLQTEGVRSYDHKLMAQDFEMQRALRPSLRKAVFHGILSFYPGEKVADEKIVEIAEEYLQKLGITDTQYAITKHIDKDHLHLHVIANLVNNNGKTIKDSWIGLRGKKVAQELTVKHGLKEALSKNLSLTNLEALNEKEANRYIIYQAILEHLPQCKGLVDLKEKLEKENIETLFKYKGQTTQLQGVSFKVGSYKYKGSEIDRKFSVGNLEKTIQQGLSKNLKQTRAESVAKLLPKFDHQNHGIHKEHSRSIADLLMKPEKTPEQVPQEFKIQKHPKKKRGLHL